MEYCNTFIISSYGLIFFFMKFSFFRLIFFFLFKIHEKKKFPLPSLKRLSKEGNWQAANPSSYDEKWKSKLMGAEPQCALGNIAGKIFVLLLHRNYRHTQLMGLKTRKARFYAAEDNVVPSARFIWKDWPSAKRAKS